MAAAGRTIKPSLPMITESSENIGAPEIGSLGSESGLEQQKQQHISSTVITRLESAVNNVRGSSLDHKDGLEEADVSYASGGALSSTTLILDGTKCGNEPVENENNDTDDPQSRTTQGFDDEDIFHIPTLEEALHLWSQWQCQSQEQEIGDFVAERLGMNDPQPSPAQVSQLEVWLRRFITIYKIKDTITRLQKEFGTREGRMKGEKCRYSEIIFKEREKITDIGLDGNTGLNGNILLNEYADTLSDSAPALLFKWATFMDMDTQEEVREIHVEARVGDLVSGLFAGQDWKKYR
jgi:hypothetical protein